MAVIYTGSILAKGAKTHHFTKKGIQISILYRAHSDKYNQFPRIKCVFKKNDYTGIIRTTCYGNSFAVDYSLPNSFRSTDGCLTTECKTLQEAKDILYAWFYENCL